MCEVGRHTEQGQRLLIELVISCYQGRRAEDLQIVVALTYFVSATPKFISATHKEI